MNEILNSTIIFWAGACNIVNGSPGHFQSLGLVKQGNRTIEPMIVQEKQTIVPWNGRIGFQKYSGCIFVEALKDSKRSQQRGVMFKHTFRIFEGCKPL